MEIPYEHKKNLFMVMMTDYWNKLTREDVGSPSMEIFKTNLNIFLYNLL